MISSNEYKFGLLKSIDLAQVIAPSAKIPLDKASCEKHTVPLSEQNIILWAPKISATLLDLIFTSWIKLLSSCSMINFFNSIAVPEGLSIFSRWWVSSMRHLSLSWLLLIKDANDFFK